MINYLEEDWKYLIEVVFVAILSLIVFFYFIQPLLVHIHPMFAFQGRLSSGRYPDTPVGVAAMITFFVSYFIYHMVYEYVRGKYYE